MHFQSLLVCVPLVLAAFTSAAPLEANGLVKPRIATEQDAKAFMTSTMETAQAKADEMKLAHPHKRANNAADATQMYYWVKRSNATDAANQYSWVKRGEATDAAQMYYWAKRADATDAAQMYYWVKRGEATDAAQMYYWAKRSGATDAAQMYYWAKREE